MRLANAVALFALSLVLVGMGAPDAEARRGHYSKAGHRYWSNAYKRDGRRVVERRARREARLALRRRPAVRPPAPVTRPPDLLAVSEPKPAMSSTVVAVPVGAAEALNGQSATSSQTMPSPPGPVLVNSITYDFDKGVKTVSLRDGATFVEDFDPHAFFRMMPEAGPSVTSSTVPAPSGR